ncbi:hypothetical protein DI383_09795 [Flavobacteriaceae bacterium LYZ1037]|nr:hypothetical protein DI383_09795 [Flavobacteriaceae bacterium LYZ1037]
MKKITSRFIILTFFCMPVFLLAQEKNKTAKKIFGQELTIDNQRSVEETGVIRCGSTEYERALQAKFPYRETTEEFESWLAPKVEETKALLANGRGSTITIPIVFHVLTDGSGADNISEALIQAQLDQLNIDFGNMDNSPYAQAVDTDVRFCLAQQDPNGLAMSENGINRVLDYGDAGQSQGSMDGGIKQATQWDPTRYLNVWVANLGGGLLGYAQFPTGAGIPMYPGGPSNTDGVVVLNSSVGSEAMPNPAGGAYARGRTLTHEIGHWIGLHHIWGDGGCSVDDYCADTPAASGSNFGCATGVDSCTGDGPDMVENYMDYSDDTCMNTFTNDQKTRILAVMANSPNRMTLVTSNACQPAMVYDLDGRLNIEDLNIVDCSTQSLTPDVRLTNAGNNTLTSATISYYLDADTPVNYNWSGSLDINEFEIISLPEIITTSGAHTFYVELSAPNGGTDMNTSNDNASESNTFNGGACVSIGNETDTYLTSTTGVVFNTISNLNNNPGGDNGYSDFTGLSTDIAREESYDLTVNIDTDGNWPCITTVWIDWNQNCSFDDAGEEYDLGGGTGLSNQPTSNSPLAITVPSDAVLGNTTMRVTTKYFSAATSCENNHDAEVEDYSVNVLGSLSVDEFGLNSIGIYPNPTSNVLTIKATNNNVPDAYAVYNMLGQVVLSNKISTQADLTINTSSLSNGMYFIKVSKESNQVSLPFIKK